MTTTVVTVQNENIEFQIKRYLPMLEAAPDLSKPQPLPKEMPKLTAKPKVSSIRKRRNSEYYPKKIAYADVSLDDSIIESAKMRQTKYVKEFVEKQKKAYEGIQASISIKAAAPAKSFPRIKIVNHDFQRISNIAFATCRQRNIFKCESNVCIFKTSHLSEFETHLTRFHSNDPKLKPHSDCAICKTNTGAKNIRDELRHMEDHLKKLGKDEALDGLIEILKAESVSPEVKENVESETSSNASELPEMFDDVEKNVRKLHTEAKISSNQKKIIILSVESLPPLSKSNGYLSEKSQANSSSQLQKMTEISEAKISESHFERKRRKHSPSFATNELKRRKECEIDVSCSPCIKKEQVFSDSSDTKALESHSGSIGNTKESSATKTNEHKFSGKENPGSDQYNPKPTNGETNLLLSALTKGQTSKDSSNIHLDQKTKRQIDEKIEKRIFKPSLSVSKRLRERSQSTSSENQPAKIQACQSDSSSSSESHNRKIEASRKLLVEKLITEEKSAVKTSIQQLESTNKELQRTTSKPAIPTPENNPFHPRTEPIDYLSKVTPKEVMPWISPPFLRRNDKYRIVYNRMKQPSCMVMLFKCMDAKCSFSTDKSEIFFNHLRCHESDNESDRKGKDAFYLYCSYCCYKSDDVKSLVHHVNDLHSSDEFQCSHCFYRSRNKETCYLHTMEFHKGLGKEILKAPTPQYSKEFQQTQEKRMMERLRRKREANVAPITCKCKSRTEIIKFVYFLGNNFSSILCIHITNLGFSKPT